MQSWTQPSSRTMVCWGCNGCCFVNDGRYHQPISFFNPEMREGTTWPCFHGQVVPSLISQLAASQAAKRKSSWLSTGLLSHAGARPQKRKAVTLFRLFVDVGR